MLLGYWESTGHVDCSVLFIVVDVGHVVLLLVIPVKEQVEGD